MWHLVQPGYCPYRRHRFRWLVVAERLQIALEHRDIGKRKEILLEGGHIIPDIQMWRNAAPSLHVFEERCILPTPADGVRKAAFDAAKAYHHILPGLDALGRLARVLVGESADVLVGEILLDGSCHLIDEPEHCTRLATIFLHQFLAFLALARIRETYMIVIGRKIVGYEGKTSLEE